MAKRVIRGANFFKFKKSDSMGVVTDTFYDRCFWPALDRPTALFAPGSFGIQVAGPPTPRNVIFPPDTVFLNTRRTNGEPSKVPTRADCHFLRDRVKDYRTVARRLNTGEVTEEAALVEVQRTWPLDRKHVNDLLAARVAESNLKALLAARLIEEWDERPANG